MVMIPCISCVVCFSIKKYLTSLICNEGGKKESVNYSWSVSNITHFIIHTTI